MKEVRWQNGKDEYSRDEVHYMLETQRAMIHNDIKSILMVQAQQRGLRGKLTSDGENIIDYLNDCRKVDF